MSNLTFNMIVQNCADYVTPTFESIKDIADEIVVIDGGSTDDTLAVCRQYTDKIFVKNFEGDFASQKNLANIKSNGRWIFNIDSDETLSDAIKNNLKTIIHANDNLDLLFVPRVNIVDGITLDHVKQWKWTITKFPNITNEKTLETNSKEYELLQNYDLIIKEKNIIKNKKLVKYYMPINQYPDMQSRLYKNMSGVAWKGKVHERIVGHKHFALIPANKQYNLHLMHRKNIKKQEKQNAFYNTIVG